MLKSMEKDFKEEICSWFLGSASSPSFPPQFCSGHLPLKNLVLLPSLWLVSSSEFWQDWKMCGNHGCDNSMIKLSFGWACCPCQQMELWWTSAPLPALKLPHWLGRAPCLALWSWLHKLNALLCSLCCSFPHRTWAALPQMERAGCGANGL